MSSMENVPTVVITKSYLLYIYIAYILINNYVILYTGIVCKGIDFWNGNITEPGIVYNEYLHIISY